MPETRVASPRSQAEIVNPRTGTCLARTHTDVSSDRIPTSDDTGAAHDQITYTDPGAGDAFWGIGSYISDPFTGGLDEIAVYDHALSASEVAAHHALGTGGAVGGFAGTTTYTYDPAGNLRTTTTPDGITATNHYDEAGRLLEVANVSASATLSRSSYLLDPVGNRLTTTTTRGSTYYTYDALDRLTDACFDATCAGSRTPVACLGCIGGLMSTPAAAITPNAADHETTWTYDYVGNRLSEVDYTGTTAYSYDLADRLTTVDPPGPGTVAYGYNANGDETSAGSDTFSYDLAEDVFSPRALASDLVGVGAAILGEDIK